MTPSPWWRDMLNPRRVLSGDKVVAHCAPEDQAVIAAAPEMQHLLTMALPYVETAAEDDHYDLEGKLRISVLAGEMRAAIEKAEGKEA